MLKHPFRILSALAFSATAGAISAQTAYVSDAYTGAIEVFDAGNGSFQGEIGVGFLLHPSSVVASSDTVFVSDYDGIYAFGADGSFKNSFGQGFASNAKGMALAGNDLYQVDAAGQIFDFDSQTGALLNSFGTNILSSPLAATAAGDRLYVTDGEYVRIFDRATGDLLDSIDAGARRDLTGLAISKDGTLFAADRTMADILAFDLTTNLVSDEFGSGFLIDPYSLAISPDGMLNVGDFGQQCVFRFDEQGGFFGLYGDGFLTLPTGISFGTTAVPEPAAFIVYGLGLVAARKRRARSGCQK